MEVILIGQQESKRTQYFLEAAKTLGQKVNFISYDDVESKNLEGAIIKIDPPKYESFYVDELPALVKKYEQVLVDLSKKESLRFFNHPKGILDTLDKRVCKKRLQDANISITPLIADGVMDFETLKEILKVKKSYQVFIKPNKGSGACGVIAYRMHPRRQEEIAYTSLMMEKGRLLNTKKIRKLTDAKVIGELCEAILQQGAIVEGWLPKATYKGIGYDLRVVYQFGKLAYVVARQSSSPITNLHLNNQAQRVEELNLSQETIVQIEEVCQQAMNLYPGELSYAGIDLLLEKNTLKPYIIEINGQGDLLYQDIYDENLIYKMQLMEVRQHGKEDCR